VFLRSPHAHAQILSISVPPAARGRVFTAADLPRLKPIQVVTQAAGARAPPWPPLAVGKVRYVGDAVPRASRRPARMPSTSPTP
jgi:aerobic carbon-monoxide dehydrogenase large subunit